MTTPFPRQLRRSIRRRGAAAVLAMLFLVLFTSLAAAMFTVATSNVQAAQNLSDTERARAAAEGGLRWMTWRFTQMNRPRTPIGNITSSVADSLWPSIRNAIASDLAGMLNPAERSVSVEGATLSTASIATDSGAAFRITVRQHPFDSADPLDQRYLRVTSVGTYRNISRTVWMDFKIDKKVRYAIADPDQRLSFDVLSPSPPAAASP